MNGLAARLWGSTRAAIRVRAVSVRAADAISSALGEVDRVHAVTSSPTMQMTDRTLPAIFPHRPTLVETPPVGAAASLRRRSLERHDDLYFPQQNHPE